MLLDVPTLILLAAVACWALAVAAWRMKVTGHTSLLRGWAAAMFLEGCAFLLFLLRGSAPDWLSIVIANILLTSAYVLIGETIARYRQVPISPWLLRSPPLLILLIFPFILDQQSTRNLLAAVIEGAQILVAIWLLWRRGPVLSSVPTGLGPRLLVLGLMLSILIFSMRILVSLWGQDPAPNVTDPHSLQVITFAVGLISVLLTGLGFLIMVKDGASGRRSASADFDTAPPTGRHAITPWLLLLLVLGLLGGQMAYDLRQTRQLIERTAQEQLENHSLVLAEELERRVRAIDVALKTMRDVLPEQLGRPGGNAVVQQQLHSMTQALEGVRTLLVFDASGKVIAGNRTELVGRNFAYRDYFKTMQQNPQGDRLHVARPFTTVLGAYSVSLVRARYDRNGEFAGIVSATIDQDSLRDLMLSLRAGGQTRLSVVYDSGTLIKLVPESAKVLPGSVVGKPGTFFSRHRESGQSTSLMTGVSGTVGTVSYMSMRTLQLAELHMDHGLIIAAARNQEDVLVPWRKMLGARVAVFLLVATISALLLAVYLHHRRQFERELQQQDEARQRLTVTLQRFIDHLPGTAYVKDADSVTLMANRGFSPCSGWIRPA